MRWPVELFAFSLSLGFSMVLASSCGTPGLGIDNNSTLGVGGSSSGTGGKGGTGGTGGSTITGLVFDSGLPDTNYSSCVPLTCSELGSTCGPAGDGCNGVIQCGSCKSPTTCGGGGKLSTCGGNNSCVMKTCADWGANCGPVSDGCGGLLQCGTCNSPQTCGGGNTPSVCGGNSGCVPAGCAAQNANCGPIGDGCGGIVQCGSCLTPQTCGGGGVPSICGDGSADGGNDGGNNCVPTTCTALGIGCGPTGDGCGGQLDCGTCAAPTTCGGGGKPGQCGGNTGCTSQTCATLGFNCGPAGDGCGNTIQCGSCTAPTTCGGGGVPSQCGGDNNCVPRTCASLGLNCGPAGDGCGGLLNCGTLCPGGEICGGGGQPGVCGPTDAGALGCTGLCQQQTTCLATGATTTISGTVYAPNGTDPLYNALVFVPNGGPAPAYGVQPFSAGVHCGQCGSEVTGSPLVSTVTAPDGTFQLQNVPVGTNIPLVIQLGRWRRMTFIPSIASCVNTALTAAETTLPSQEAVLNPYDNIPLMAFSTGNVDGLECVLLKIGINANQFSDPAAQGGAGRIRLYKGEGAAGAQFSTKTPTATQLWGAGADGGAPDIDQYDMVYFPCQGAEYQKNAADQTVVVNYANAGGRIFATHFSYVWFIDPTPAGTANPFLGAAAWTPNGTPPTPDPGTGFINTSFTRGQALAQWLQITGSSTTYAQMPINTLRRDFSAVTAPSLLWVSTQPPSANIESPMHMTFDTPVGSPPASQCGRVVFSDFHVENSNGNGGLTFPAECPAGAMTAQEKMLEFMLFDLASCIIPTTPITPTCIPQTCASQGLTCGPAGDGCGNELQCGTCTVKGQTCGGGGVPGVCGGMACTSLTCAGQGFVCGPAGDGCGNLLECGNCKNGQTCGAGGPGKCGATVCTPITCASQKIQCGPAGNGCGGALQCGNCPPGEFCGYGGKPGVCGSPDASSCDPLTCAAQSISCGPAGDGCGGQLDCGTCTAPQTCGGGGVPGVCGAAICTPTTCSALNLMCGPAGDGCGGILQCGTCPVNTTCGGGGVAGMCGSPCVPTTCAKLGFNCGPAGDGCGNLLQCGPCTAPDSCGGGGVNGICGHTGTN